MLDLIDKSWSRYMIVYESPEAALTAHNYGVVTYRAKIKVLPRDDVKYAQFEGKLFETTVGRILFNDILPADYPYELFILYNWQGKT